jgi:pyrroline-5-carboxylate reductase
MLKQFPQSILIYGCGNMGGAMLAGWIAAGIDPKRFCVVDPFANGLPTGVRHIAHSTDIETPFEIIFLGIKPQMLAELSADIGRYIRAETTVISILAGIECHSLQAYFPSAKIIRLMPNLSAAIGKSPMGLWSQVISGDEKAFINEVLAPLGTPVWLSDENQMNAVTALAGSGPAFVYRFIDALAKGGAALGLEPAIAAQLALSMVEGAALLAAHANDTPAALADKVTSPGGTTAAGLAILDKDSALENIIAATLRSAQERGAELGGAALTKT